MDTGLDNHHLQKFSITCKVCNSDDTSIIVNSQGATLFCAECDEEEEIKS